MYNKREVFADNNDILKMSVDASNTALQGIENAIALGKNGGSQ